MRRQLQRCRLSILLLTLLLPRPLDAPARSVAHILEVLSYLKRALLFWLLRQSRGDDDRVVSVMRIKEPYIYMNRHTVQNRGEVDSKKFHRSRAQAEPWNHFLAQLRNRVPPLGTRPVLLYSH